MSVVVRSRRRRLPYKTPSGTSATTPNSEINVTPLVDVCLVLLIIFMVVTPMLGPGREVELPVATVVLEHQEGDQVFVSVDREGAWIQADVYVEREAFVRDLATALEAARGRAVAHGYAGPLLLVQGDRNTDFAVVKTVLQWIDADPRTRQYELALVVAPPRA